MTTNMKLNFTPPSVLIVEDEELLRELLMEAMSELGAHVQAVETADAGWAAFENAGSLDLLITDVRTPGKMNGWDLAAAIYLKCPGLPVIITSGFSANPPTSIPPTACFIQKPWSLAVISQLAYDRLNEMESKLPTSL